MSIEYSLKIKEHKLTLDFIKKIIRELFGEESIATIENNSSIISTFEKLGFRIDLVDARKFPYNIWDCDISKSEFEYSQILIFSIDKEFYDFEILYSNLYKIIFTLMKTINTESLLVSTVEICYFKNKSDVTILKNEYISINENNKNLLDGWNVVFIENE